MQTRTVLLTIPDDDSCENTIRYAAKEMREGKPLVVFGRSPLISDEDMPELISRMGVILKQAEALMAINGKLHS